MRTVYDKRTTFTAMDGTEIHFKPFSFSAYENALENLRQEYRDRGEQIDKPTYTVKFATGAQQQFEHDEKSILKAGPEVSPEDAERVVEEQKTQWQAWKDTTVKFDKEGNEILWDFIRNDSLEDLKLPADTSWETKQTRRHVKIPDDPEAKLMHYLNTELLKSTSDQLEFIETIVLVSRGIVEEAQLESAKKSFRNSLWSDGLQQLARRDAAGKAEDSQTGKLDQQPETNHPESAQAVAINEG